MSANAIIFDEHGVPVPTEVPHVDKAIVDATIKAMLPAMKVHGESVAQAIADSMEKGLEGIAKALEADEPLNKGAADTRSSYADMEGHDVVGGTILTPEERAQVASLYIHAYGSTKGDQARAIAKMQERGGRLAGVAEKLLTESDTGGLGILVPETIRQTVKALKDSAVVVRRMAGGSLTVRGALTIPKEVSRATAYYSDENTDIKISDFSMGAERISPKKLTCMIATSNELLRDGTDISGLMGRQMRRAYGLREGRAFLLGPGTEYQPKGLYNQLTSSGNASGTTVQAVRDDAINALVHIMSQDHETSSAAWTMNANRWGAFMKLLADDSSMAPFAAEMAAGRFFGYDVFQTNQIPEDLATGSTIGLFIRDYITVIDSDDFSIESSRDASFIDKNGVLISAFSRDLSVSRLTHRATVDYEYPEAGYLITNAKYE